MKQIFMNLWAWFKNWFVSRDKPHYQKAKPRPRKVKVVLENLIRITSGRNHAWYESNVGIIRKPIQPL